MRAVGKGAKVAHLEVFIGKSGVSPLTLTLHAAFPLQLHPVYSAAVQF